MEHFSAAQMDKDEQGGTTKVVERKHGPHEVSIPVSGQRNAAPEMEKGSFSWTSYALTSDIDFCQELSIAFIIRAFTHRKMILASHIRQDRGS